MKKSGYWTAAAGIAAGLVAGSVLLPVKADAQSGTDTWISPGIGPKSYGFFDPRYPTAKDQAQHLGVDIDLDAGDTVFSPVDGIVIANNTAGYSADAAHLIIKDNGTGIYHVLGHISSNLASQTQVSRGAPVGKVMIWIDADGHDNSHVHWGANSKGISAKAVDKWGWGRAPGSATPAQAKDRGWVDVTPYISRTRPVSSGQIQGPLRPAPYTPSFTVGKSTFNLPPKSQVLPEQPCKDALLTQVQGKLSQASSCIGQVTFGATNLLIFENWERTEINPGTLRVVAIKKMVVDLGSVSLKEEMKSVIVEGKNLEFIAISTKNWSKNPDDPPYLRYRYDENGGTPRLFLIPNALSARDDNPIRRDIASLKNPLRRIFSKPTSSSPLATRKTDPSVAPAHPAGRSTSQASALPACATADWAGTVRSIPDLFECDTPKAISSLSQGRQVQILVESVQFSNGKYMVSFQDRPSHTKQSIDDMNNHQFDWSKWNDATQSKFYRIVCIFQPASGSRLREGAHIVATAILQNYSGDTVQFNCS
jgi:Peptidase family M23